MSTELQVAKPQALPEPAKKLEVARIVATPQAQSLAPGKKSSPQKGSKLKIWLCAAAIAVGCVAAYFFWKSLQPPKLPHGFASSNGRIEATEIDVATKLGERIKDELVDEGDYVAAGQELAHMNTQVLEAELSEARAKLAVAKSAVDTAKSTPRAREAKSRRLKRRATARGRPQPSRTGFQAGRTTRGKKGHV
jgi:multidrug efflux pump subunit AcrA (membrane-fusion protein)